MASEQQHQSLMEELTCPICLDVFSDPVSLECGHNFCRSCITRCWENKGTNPCPECREESADRNLRVNWALVNLCEKVHKLQLKLKGTGSTLRCDKHQEELKLFCETDRKLICSICRDSRDHKSHNFLPIDEAAEMYRDELNSSLVVVTRRKTSALNAERQQKQQIAEVRKQSSCLQTHVASEFLKMREILDEKEKQLIRDLRIEERIILGPMEKNLHEIQQALACIECDISTLQRQMKEHDLITLLKEGVACKRRMIEEENELSLVNGKLPVGIFKGPQQYTVWREMRKNISPVPAPLTLDPDTAHCSLIVSKDRTSVKFGDKPLPDSRGKFDYWFCVLGSQGFTSGRHYWEVEVVNQVNWGVGLIRESANRRGEISLLPENGYWVISMIPRSLYVPSTAPSETLLTPSVMPQRIGVYLDYEGGQVSFYNSENMDHLHTFTDTFTERLLPIFGPGRALDGGKTSTPLTICRVTGH
ncbi:zinc-binding protein A33-like [Heterodontus francisci]|uniref:zinc-binding protein A33-like n=1 Tax=Heterodontus francisci TaxID=7792 RepID=UPI00355B027E